MADLANLTALLGEDIQPSNPSKQLSGTQLERAIRKAIRDFDPTLTVETLPAELEETILLGARATCYYTLATKFAEGMMMQIENDEFYGNQPYEHYMALAQSSEKQFNEAEKPIQVMTVTRYSMGTGTKTGFHSGEKP